MPPLIVTQQLAPGLTTLQLNRPERRNALSIALMEALCDTIGQLAKQPTARVVILQGVGPVFCAGLDLQEALDTSLVQRSAEGVQRTLTLLRDTPLVTIAAVQGGAYAGGAGLMAACDFAIGSDDVTIGFPEARRGLLPALICEVLMTKVREGDLRELFLAGSMINAARAQQIGLLQHVVPSTQLQVKAQEIANSVLVGGPHTIRATKTMLNAAYARFKNADPRSIIAAHTDARHGDEAIEGLAAFLEKRDPQWVQHTSQPRKTSD